MKTKPSTASGGMPAGAPSRRPTAKDAKKTLTRLLRIIFRGYGPRFVLVLLFILLSAGATVSTSVFLGALVDDFILPMLDGAQLFGQLLKLIFMMIAIYLVGILSSLFYNRIMVTIAQGVLRDVRDRMFDHMQTLPLRYFDTNSHGDVMSHYTNDTDTLRQMISQSIPQAFNSAVSILVILLMMLVTSPLLTLVPLAFVCIKFFVTLKIGGSSSRFFVRQQKSLADVNGYIEEIMNGQKVVKVFCHEEKARQEFDALNDTLCKNAALANAYANIIMPVLGNLGHLMYIAVAIAGGALAISGVGALTLGNIVTFLQLSKSFNMPIDQISQQVNYIVMALAGAERIFELLDEPSEKNEGKTTLVDAAEQPDGTLAPSPVHTGVWAWKTPQPDGSAVYTRLRGDVRLTDVDFGYVPEKQVLHGMTLYAAPGQKVALVGATGAGKTTITNLINRFYDIDGGGIVYDGIDVRDICKNDLRRSLGIVLQDVSLFTGTVMDNIRYGRLDATDEECIAAAKRANAHDFITLLPDGYQTMLSGGGSNLSQGQRQLLSIARCAVADPPVMILDEATSSIDTRTEAIVQRGMDALMHGRTVFVIAHRLSTVQNADVIIVLDHGRIIERGSHERLIEKRGVYYQLYTGAFELE